MRKIPLLFLSCSMICLILGQTAAAMSPAVADTAPPGFLAELIQTSDTDWINVTGNSPYVAGPDMPYTQLKSSVSVDSFSVESYTESIGTTGERVSMNSSNTYSWYMPFTLPNTAILDSIRFVGNYSTLNALNIYNIMIGISNTTMGIDQLKPDKEIYRGTKNYWRCVPTNEFNGLDNDNWTTIYTNFPYLNSSQTTNNTWLVGFNFIHTDYYYSWKYSSETTPEHQSISYNETTSRFENVTIKGEYILPTFEGEYFTPIVQLTYLPDNMTDYSSSFTLENNPINAGSSYYYNRYGDLTSRVDYRFNCTKWANFSVRTSLTSEYRLNLVPTFTQIDVDGKPAGGTFAVNIDTPLLGNTKMIRVVTPREWTINEKKAPDTSLHFTTTLNDTHSIVTYSGDLLVTGQYSFTMSIPNMGTATDLGTIPNNPSNTETEGGSVDGVPIMGVIFIGCSTILGILGKYKPKNK